MRPRLIRTGSLDPLQRDATFGGSRLALCQQQSGAPGRDYLIRQRGVDWSTIANFRLGYVPFSAPSDLAGRIVIPIYDAYDDMLVLSVRPIYKILRMKTGEEAVAINLRGIVDRYHFVEPDNKPRVVNMSDVVEVCDDRPFHPKYWNETYAKGDHLFGLNLAKQSIMQNGFAIVVEGQFDVIMMHSYGLTNTVGVLGGAFTPIHAQLLYHWTRQIVVLMDGDNGGELHAKKVTEILKLFEVRREFGMDMSTMNHCVVKLPPGFDPDSFLRKNGAYVMRQNILSQLTTGGLWFDKRWAA